jgi:hypothetical protein
MSCQVSPLEEDQELSGGQANKSAKVIGSYGEQPKAFLVYGAITKPSGLHARSLHTYFREIKAPGCELGPAVDLGELPGGDPADSDFEVVEAYATEDRLVTLGKGGSAFHAALAELSGKVVWNSNQSQHKPYILRAVSPEYFVLVSDIVEAFPPDFITSELRSMRTGEVVDAEDCTPQESSSPCDQSWLTAIGGSTVLPGGKDWFTAIGEEGSGIAHFARVTLPGFTSPWGFSEEDPQFQGYNQLLRDPIIALDANLNPTAVGSIGPSRSPAIIGGSQGAFERPLTQAEAQALDLKIVGATNNAIYADTSEGRIILDFDGMTTGSWSSWYPTGDISTPLGRLTMWRNESEDTHWIGPTGTKPDGA